MLGHGWLPDNASRDYSLAGSAGKQENLGTNYQDLVTVNYEDKVKV